MENDKKQLVEGAKAGARIIGHMMKSIIVPLLNTASTVVKQAGSKLEEIK